MRCCLKITLIVCCALASSAGVAAGMMDDQIPTFSVNATGGMSTYTSEMIKSQTSSTVVGYGISTYAGDDRSVGVSLQFDQSVHEFETAGIPSGSINTANQDIVIKYRYGPVYLGVVVGSTTWAVSRLIDPEDVTTEVEELMNVTASGFGGNFGLAIPAGRDSVVYLDVVSLTPSTVQSGAVETTSITAEEAADRSITFGSRMDIDLGGRFKLTKRLVDGIVGLKRRTSSVSIDSESFTEVLSSTYLGLSLGWTF